MISSTLAGVDAELDLGLNHVSRRFATPAHRSACCLAALPYIGTVILLPVDVFWRGYSAYFIQQYGFPIFAGAGADDTAEVFE